MSQFPPPTPGENPYAIPPQDEINFLDDPPKPTPPKRMGSLAMVGVAWLVITVVGGFMISLNFIINLEDLSENEARVEIQQVNSTAKMAISSANSSQPDMSIMSTIKKGPFEHRLCYILIQSELEGIQDAQETLQDLDDTVEETQYTLNENQIRLSTLVGNLLSDYEKGDWSAGSLSKDDREFLVDQLGYCARIGLAPSEGDDLELRNALIEEADQNASKFYWVFGAALLAGLIGFLCSVILAILLAVRFTTGNAVIRSHFEPDTRRGRIYGETFAVWICCFLLVPLLVVLPIRLAGWELSSVGSAAVGVASFFGSLIALFWPGLRGISFGQVCQDIGWTIGNPLKEIGAGVFAYLANLPIMLAGLIAAGALAMLSEQLQDKHELEATRTASHPIVEQIAQGEVMLIVMVILTACVAAPIVEETVFRGLLYRHLRELSLTWARVASVVFATLVNSVIFAAIHPQGWTAIPVLTSLAIGFSWAREWRGSLIAPMVMHAMNNFFITMVMLSMFN